MNKLPEGYKFLRVQIFAELIFAFFALSMKLKFREIYKLVLDREN